MPRPVGYGRPGTQVIPTDWDLTHARVVAKTHTCTVRIGAGGAAPTFDPATRRTRTTAAAPIYDGPAGISPVAQPADPRVVVEDPTETSRYLVHLDAQRAGVDQVTVDHAVTVTAGAHLAGYQLQIVGIVRDPLTFEVDLLCTLVR